VGDGDFGYSRSLSERRSDWRIVGTAYGNGSNSQALVGIFGNLSLYTNVDAKKLESGRVTGVSQYDAIVFNNPHDGNRTASLIREFKQSARRVLAPGGEIHINVTKRLLQNHPEVWPELGVPNAKASTLNSLRTFRETDYYAPFMPHYTDGGAMNWYRYDPTGERAGDLKNFVFR
jgi:hypothetical protein